MNNLVVVGGAVVGVNADSQYVTKPSIANYLNTIAASFHNCVWIARYDTNNLQGGVINSCNVRVVPIENTKLHRIKALKIVSENIAPNSFILYYLPNPYLPIFPLLKYRACRLVTYLANDYEMTIQNYSHSRWIGWRYLFRASYEIPLRYSDAIIARGKRLDMLARKFNSNVYETVPLGNMDVVSANRAYIKLPMEYNEINILYVGKILISKGINDLIYAFKGFVDRSKIKNIKLHIVGQGEDLPAIQKLVSSIGLNNLVVFHGWIANMETIDNLYTSAQVLVVPTSIYPEGVPRVIDEALIRGIPVIATRVGGIPQEFENGEIMLVEPGNLEELSRSIEIMLFDNNIRLSYIDKINNRREILLGNESVAEQHLSILMNR